MTARLSRLVVFPALPISVVGNFSVIVPPTWASKDPADTVTYAADFTNLLDFGQSIVGVGVSVVGDPLLFAVQRDVIDSVVTLVLAGGTDQARATIMLTSRLSDGGQVRRGVAVAVVSQGNASAANPESLVIGGVEVSIGRNVMATSRPTLGIGGVEVAIGGTTIDIGG